MAAFQAVGDHAGVEAEKGGVEGEDALDVREHEVGGGGRVLGGVGMRCARHAGEGGVGGEVGGFGVCGRAGGGDWCFRGEEQVGFGGDDAAHGVADKDGVYGGVDGGRRGGVCDFDVDDFVQEPDRLVRKENPI